MTDVVLAPVGTAPRRSLWRLAAIGLFLGLPLGCAAVAGLALTAGAESNEIADHADATARAIVHQLDRKSDVAESANGTAALYLASANASLARAELQALAGRLIDGAGGRLVEVRPADEAGTEPSGRVSIEIALATTNAGLLDLLYAIETGLPLLTVPRLDATASGSGDELQVTLTLEGRWKGAAP
jgi:hypothetical protein